MNEHIEVRVADGFVSVYRNGARIYQLEPDGENWTSDSSYQAGHAAVLAAAASIYQAAVQIADMDGLKECRNCGDFLTDVQWTADPCPASPDGDHAEVTPSTRTQDPSPGTAPERGWS